MSHVLTVLSRFSRVWLFATLWTVARQAPLPMGFSRREYWSGLLSLPPGDLPDSGIEPTCPESPAVQADSLPLSHWASPKFCWLQLWLTESSSTSFSSSLLGHTAQHVGSYFPEQASDPRLLQWKLGLHGWAVREVSELSISSFCFNACSSGCTGS